MSDLVQSDPDTGGLSLIFDSEINYEDAPGSGKQRRLIEQVRTLYRPDDFGQSRSDPLALLPLGQLQPLAIPGETYRLALTPGLLAQVYRRPSDDDQSSEDLLPDPGAVLAVDAPAGESTDRGGYLSSQALRNLNRFPPDQNDAFWNQSDTDGHWWIPSGRVFYSPDGNVPGGNDPSTSERAHALEHFFLPFRYRDPFHLDQVNDTETVLDYDDYDLLLTATQDPLQNRVTSENDYRVLQPRLVTDPNGNRSAVAFDALGLVVGTALRGKETESLGDTLAGLQADLPQDTIDQFFTAPKGPLATDLLKDATTRVVYDVTRYQRFGKDNPVYAATIARETHANDPLPAGELKLQISFSYSDGFGREAQRKIQAEPGPVPRRDNNGRIIVDADGQPEMTTDPAPHRWVGSGWTVFNNKGKPVRQFEPFFSNIHRFDDDPRIGVSPILFYDPVERVVATLHPNHTYEKVVFDAWYQETWDVNDTALQQDPKNDPHVGGFFNRLADDEYLPTWHARRINGQMGQAEMDAAAKTVAHAETPTLAHLDSLGRVFLTIADNATAEDGSNQTYETRIELDIEGNQREIEDARANPVMTYHYDMLGNPIRQHSMDAGRRWTVNDAAGQGIRRWDDLNRVLRTTYDALRRPTGLWVSVNRAAETLAEETLYGETQSNPEANNLRGQIYQQRDGAGVVTYAYDFKGNVLETTRKLLANYRDPVNWSQSPSLENDSYTSRTNCDALNRPIQVFAPHAGQVMDLMQYTYNDAGLLESVDVWLKQQLDLQQFRWLDAETADYRPVRNIDYNARGQRTNIRYGSGGQEYDNKVFTEYDYDPQTFRLTRLHTVRPSDGADLQDLNYTYDPSGNITQIRDDAQYTIYFNNRRVEPSATYTYDAIYRLIEATGREHLGQLPNNGNRPPRPFSPNDSFRVNLQHPGDGNAMGRYLQRYEYDQVGNILSMRHRGTDPSHPGWKRCYQYADDSNRLLSTGGPRDAANLMLEPDTLCPTHYAPVPIYPERYDYDAHGNMTQMSHLDAMTWDFKDQLQATARQVVNNGSTPETTYYVYDAGGQRVRKVTQRQNGDRKDERIYLGGFEIYRKYSDSGNLVLERETLHVMDDQQRVALIETRTQGDDGSLRELIRYQLGNHLGSASLELDGAAEIISYEEYSPYGSTSYQAVRNQTETPKRYRYSGKERDEESGLYYYGARYYAGWLGRWCSGDPVSLADGVNLYIFVTNNPVSNIDIGGLQTISPEQREAYLSYLENTLLRFDKESLKMSAAKLAWEYIAHGRSEHRAIITYNIQSYKRALGEAKEGDYMVPAPATIPFFTARPVEILPGEKMMAGDWTPKSLESMQILEKMSKISSWMGLWEVSTAIFAGASGVAARIQQNNRIQRMSDSGRLGVSVERLAGPTTTSGGSNWEPESSPAADYGGTPEGVSIPMSQKHLREVLENGGAVRVGPTGMFFPKTTKTKISEERGEVYVIDTKWGPMEIRIMEGKEGGGTYSGQRTVFTKPYKGTGKDIFLYPSGKPITGNIKGIEQKEIGHVHGQVP